MSDTNLVHEWSDTNLKQELTLLQILMSKPSFFYNSIRPKLLVKFCNFFFFVDKCTFRCFVGFTVIPTRYLRINDHEEIEKVDSSAVKMDWKYLLERDWFIFACGHAF